MQRCAADDSPAVRATISSNGMRSTSTCRSMRRGAVRRVWRRSVRPAHRRSDSSSFGFREIRTCRVALLFFDSSLSGSGARNLGKTTSSPRPWATISENAG
jgi:hypothetical protein